MHFFLSMIHAGLTNCVSQQTCIHLRTLTVTDDLKATVRFLSYFQVLSNASKAKSNDDDGGRTKLRSYICQISP